MHTHKRTIVVFDTRAQAEAAKSRYAKEGFRSLSVHKHLAGGLFTDNKHFYQLKGIDPEFNTVTKNAKRAQAKRQSKRRLATGNFRLFG